MYCHQTLNKIFEYKFVENFDQSMEISSKNQTSTMIADSACGRGNGDRSNFQNNTLQSAIPSISIQNQPANVKSERQRENGTRITFQSRRALHSPWLLMRRCRHHQGERVSSLMYAPYIRRLREKKKKSHENAVSSFSFSCKSLFFFSSSAVALLRRPKNHVVKDTEIKYQITSKNIIIKSTLMHSLSLSLLRKRVNNIKNANAYWKQSARLDPPKSKVIRYISTGFHV